MAAPCSRWRGVAVAEAVAAAVAAAAAEDAVAAVPAVAVAASVAPSEVAAQPGVSAASAKFAAILRLQINMRTIDWPGSRSTRPIVVCTTSAHDPFSTKHGLLPAGLCASNTIEETAGVQAERCLEQGSLRRAARSRSDR